MSELRNPRELIERAFDQARRSGKPDWWSMTIPVLKNRILQISERKFREADYGARSFREFLRNASDVIEVQETPLPGQATLRSAIMTESLAEPKSSQPDIRPDLWEATLDFTSQNRYIWDVAEGRARAALADEQGLQLPTITADELDGWRMEFSEQQGSADEPTLKQLERWRESRLPTLALPPACRGLWNKYLKDHVRQRLEKWAEENQLGGIPTGQISTGKAAPDGEVQKLRDFVIRCVQQMPKAELEELRISPTSVMRVLSK